jgi:hypothetical protein
VVRFQQFLNGRHPDEALLREYLNGHVEWVGLEFKTADREPTFGLRKTVAAFANTDGGDVFLGVDNDRNPVGTRSDPAAISRVLNQEEAAPRNGYVTNLVLLVRSPVPIPLENAPPVLWIDVAPSGVLAGALKSDGSLGLYLRPGAESPEATGFDAIDVFRRKTRARLLHDLYEQVERIVPSLSLVPQGPNVIREETIAPIRRILDSPEWALVAKTEDWNLMNSSYLGTLLRYPADYASWYAEGLRYQELENRNRMRVLSEIDQGRRALRAYLVSERILTETN